MRRTVILGLVLMSVLAPLGCSNRRSPQSEVVTSVFPAEAVPVRNWMQSVKARDLGLFRTVFSKRMCAEFSVTPWEHLLASYVFLWGDVLTNFDVETVDYVVLADAERPRERARVVITMGEQEYPSIRVVKEDGLWFVDDR